MAYEKLKKWAPWAFAALLAIMFSVCYNKAHAQSATAGSISGSASDSRSLSNSDAASKSNSNQTQGQTQGQTQSAGAAAVQGQSANNLNVINFPGNPANTTATISTDTNIHGTQRIESAPAIGMGILSPTTPCSNTYQLGVSGMGFGVGAGGSVVDLDCTRREYARILWAAGAQQAAIGMLCQNEELQKVAPVLCRRSKDELTAGQLPAAALPAYPNNSLPPAPAPKTSAAPAVERDAQAAVPATNNVAAVPPKSAVSGPQVGDVMKGNDGVTYRFTGSAWVKVAYPKQPLVQFDAKLSRNEFTGTDIKE